MTRLYRHIVPVPNIGEAARFYAAVFEMPGERVSSGRHYFDLGGVILALYQPDADGDAVAGGWKFHDAQYLYFAVDSLESIQSRFLAAGGTVTDDVAVQPWGERSFYGLDPFGTPLSFVDEATIFRGGRYIG